MSVVPKAEPEEKGLAVPLRLRITRAQGERIRAVCEETGRKRSDVVRRLLDAGLDSHEEKSWLGTKRRR